MGGGLDLHTDIGFSVIDVFTSAMTLHKNFMFVFALVYGFVICPWIFDIIITAIRRAKSTREDWDDEDWYDQNSNDPEFRRRRLMRQWTFGLSRRWEK